MWFRQEMSSIFYVQSADRESINLTRSSNKMETEVRSLKQELACTQDALKAATRRCRDLVKELDHRVAGHESERSLRDQQLSRILRALLVLEARLKQEQKSIRQLLCEKDNVIRNQQLEIAMLRRYTKNYIKCKRDRTSDNTGININVDKDLRDFGDLQRETLPENGIGKEIASLKHEIITRLNPISSADLEDMDRSSVRKTHSFAGSDISKVSVTSSENTDASIITTTTEGSPSLLSTEGFCEGESTDVSPGSTLNKCSNRCTPTTVTDSENETTMIVDESEEGTTRMTSLRRLKGQRTMSKGTSETIERTTIARTESKDDGLDCNFVSEDEEDKDAKTRTRDREPIYVNACNRVNERNLQQMELSRTTHDDYSNNNETKIVDRSSELTVEDTSGNWYSDPDEDRLNDGDVLRRSSYWPNGNHNSVLECVNQILLRDMEEEENSLPVPRRFKHRGRIVHFQPARLSDIESVGSEMERRNSEETAVENKEIASRETEIPANETAMSEDEYGMRIIQRNEDDEFRDSKAIPLVIIEPKIDAEEEARKTLVKSQVNNSPPLKMERIEEKTCLQMSTRGLTIAKNLDYEDIESLPDVTVMSPRPPRTPPALPPKPQFRNNTLILKKIPSPSFLIDEKRQQDSAIDCARERILGLVISAKSKTARILNLEETKSTTKNTTAAKETNDYEESGFWRNRFNHVRSSFQVRQKEMTDQTKGIARVTNIVRHFEEFKIGDPEEKTRDRKERYAQLEHIDKKTVSSSEYRDDFSFAQDFDIRQNFEEFNLDECDLSDDPNRPEADGSERMSHQSGISSMSGQDENNITKDNNNVPTVNGNTEFGYDHFLEATGLSNKSILTPSRLLSNHKNMLKPKDIKYKNKIKAMPEKHGEQAANNTIITTTTTTSTTTTHVRHWTGPFV